MPKVDREYLRTVLRYGRKNWLADPDENKYQLDDLDTDLIADLIEKHWEEENV